MADNKKFYWIKLKTDFFDLDTIDFLLSQKNGCAYVVLYQMLCLKSANNNGLLCTQMGEMIVPYDVNKIVRETKYFDIDTVVIALEMFKRLGLIYETDENVLKIVAVEEMVGSESASKGAERARRFRNKKKQETIAKKNGLERESVTNRNVTSVTKDNTEYRVKSIELRDKSIDNNIYNNSYSVSSVNGAENQKNFGTVTLTTTQHEQLLKDFGQSLTEKYIKKVDDYQRQKSRQFDNNYDTIRKWILEDRKSGKLNEYSDGFDPEKYKFLINNF